MQELRHEIVAATGLGILDEAVEAHRVRNTGGVIALTRLMDHVGLDRVSGFSEIVNYGGTSLAIEDFVAGFIEATEAGARADAIKNAASTLDRTLRKLYVDFNDGLGDGLEEDGEAAAALLLEGFAKINQTASPPLKRRWGRSRNTGLVQDNHPSVE